MLTAQQLDCEAFALETHCYQERAYFSHGKGGVEVGPVEVLSCTLRLKTSFSPDRLARRHQIAWRVRQAQKVRAKSGASTTTTSSRSTAQFDQIEKGDGKAVELNGVLCVS